MGLEETRQTWPMFSQLKALIDSERFRVIVFQYRAKNDNSELGIFTSKHDPIVKVKLRVIVFQYRAKNDNSEFEIFTSNHDSMCHKKFRAIVFMYRAKNNNSELGIHLRTNSEISKFSENSELSLWPSSAVGKIHKLRNERLRELEAPWLVNR